MSATPGWCLRLKAQPDFRVDFGGVLPARLAGMTADEVARVEVRHGNELLALGELFDIATLDGEGYLRLTDRAKDVIKSGGEWISTLDLEEAVCSHPAVAMAAAVGVPHPKWDERPLLLVTLRPGQSADPEVLKAHVAERVAKWWTPDEVRIVDALPIGPTGKVLKRELRETLAAQTAAVSRT